MVVKQDPNGYGFNLSKEMPVFVMHVNHGSSAERAGITPGDRIMKVTGFIISTTCTCTIMYMYMYIYNYMYIVVAELHGLCN